MSLRLPAILARLTANRRLIQACTAFLSPNDAAEHVLQALDDGANPNHEMFHKTWRERVGTRFEKKKWWGGGGDEPIYGSCLHENYWRTPLASATDAGFSAQVDLLLEAGADPWALGNGSSGWCRPCPMANIFRATRGHLSMVRILDRHFDHIVASYPAHPPTAAAIYLDEFEKVAADHPEASRFLKKLRSHLDARALERQTPDTFDLPQPAPAPTVSAPRPRL